MTWDNPKDELGRKEESELVTELLIENFRRGAQKKLVLNVNSGWGLGKTYFLKNWAEDLRAKKHPVIYIDAWQTDYSNDPLLAILDQVESGLESFLTERGKYKELLNETVSKGWLLIKSAPGIAARIALKSGLDDLKDSFDEHEDLAKVAVEESGKEIESLITKSAKKALKQHQETARAIKAFRVTLQKLAGEIDKLKSHEAPIFIFIDELDRCRPTYAIELLETVKHIFEVEGVYFVVATDTKQLSHSVKAVYGAEFEAEIYLRRFFDIQYSLSEPDYLSFSRKLASEFGYIDSPPEFYPPSRGSKANGEANSFPNIIAQINEAFQLSLRDQEQCFQLLSLFLAANESEKVYLFFAYFLIVLHHSRPGSFEFYEQENSLPEELKISTEQTISFETWDRPGTFLGEKRYSVKGVASIYVGLQKTTIDDLVKFPDRDDIKKFITRTLREPLPHSYSSDSPPRPSIQFYGKKIKHLNCFKDKLVSD